jgi:hypothetical protein
VLPGLAALAVVLVVGLLTLRTELERRRRDAARGAGVDRVYLPMTYERAVRAGWEQACAAAELRDRTTRQAPTLLPGGRPAGDGLEIPVRFGGWTLEELKRAQERLGGALGRHVAVGHLMVRGTPGRPGQGSVVVYRTHPLAALAPWPAPAGVAPRGRVGTLVAVGRAETLGPALVDLARTSMWAGQNGSGKTVGVIDMLMAAATLPWVELTVYDVSDKLGADYADMAPRLRHGRVLTSRREIVADLKAQRRALRQRSLILAGRPYQPSRRLPLRIILVEEFPALELYDRELADLLGLARQGRGPGVALHLVTQDASAAVVDSELRRELRQRLVFRMDGWDSSDSALGRGVRGADGSDGYTPIPAEWPGVFDAVTEEGVTRNRAFLPQSTVPEAREWSRVRGFGLRWSDPAAVRLARQRAFVALHVAACPPAPVSVDWESELTPQT